jgi:hypothetical protein
LDTRGSSNMTPATSMTMLRKWAIIGSTPRLAALTSAKRTPSHALTSHSPAFACQPSRGRRRRAQRARIVRSPSHAPAVMPTRKAKPQANPQRPPSRSRVQGGRSRNARPTRDPACQWLERAFPRTAGNRVRPPARPTAPAAKRALAPIQGPKPQKAAHGPPEAAYAGDHQCGRLRAHWSSSHRSYGTPSSSG